MKPKHILSLSGLGCGCLLVGLFMCSVFVTATSIITFTEGTWSNDDTVGYAVFFILSIILGGSALMMGILSIYVLNQKEEW